MRAVPGPSVRLRGGDTGATESAAPSNDPQGLRRGHDLRPMMRIVSWASLLAVVLLSWLAIALVVGTVVGHGIAFGTGSDFE